MKKSLVPLLTIFLAIVVLFGCNSIPRGSDPAVKETAIRSLRKQIKDSRFGTFGPLGFPMELSRVEEFPMSIDAVRVIEINKEAKKAACNAILYLRAPNGNSIGEFEIAYLVEVTEDGGFVVSVYQGVENIALQIKSWELARALNEPGSHQIDQQGQGSEH